MTPPEERPPSIAGELLVPAMMAAFLLAYWWQAAALSWEAQAFPAALTAALVGLLAMQGIALLRRGRAGDPLARRPEFSTAASQRLALLVLAVALLAFWRELGGALVILLFTLVAMLVLGERRPLMLASLPLAFSGALTFLFKVVLRVRFPDGLLGLF